MAIPHDQPFNHMPDERSGSIPGREPFAAAPSAKAHPGSGQSFSKFEEAANKLEADIATLDKEVCQLRDQLHLVLRSKLPMPPDCAVGGIPAPAAQPAPIVSGTQGLSREVNRIRDTIVDILNRLEI